VELFESTEFLQDLKLTKFVLSKLKYALKCLWHGQH